MNQRCCALESCGKPLVKRGDEYPFQFKKRKFCKKSCSSQWQAEHPSKRTLEYHEKLRSAKPSRYRSGGGKIANFCAECGTLPHRVPGGPDTVCPECGLAFAHDRVRWEGSLVQSNAGMALPYSVE